MRAAVFHAPGDVVVQEVPAPVAEPDGIVLEVAACGVCGSDLHTFRGGHGITAGQVLGHEFAGRVVAVGPEVRDIAVGDRVAAMPLVPCRSCPACAAGELQQCPTGFRPGIGVGLPGAFAEQVHVPGARLGETVFAIPDALDLHAGALLEPLAVALHAVRRSGARPGDTVVVLGLGPIGLLAALALRAGGVECVVGVERLAERRAVAAARGLAVSDGEGSLREAVAQALGAARPVDVVLECTGVPALAAGAAQLVRRGGTVAIVALYGQPAPVDVAAFGFKETTLRGSCAYAARDFAAALDLVAAGAIVPGDLVSERVGLEALPEVLARESAAPRAGKVLVEPGR